MPELGPMMRALELQRVIEDKVSEWRERSARSGPSISEAYQHPVNFRRHTNRRKNSAEINRIIAKYSKPNKRADERYVFTQNTPEITPTRPVRKKSKLKQSKSEDNLANIGMESHPDPESTAEIKPPPRSRFKPKYSAKSYEDITTFVDIEHNRKSEHFEENSILNAKVVTKPARRKLHSISEDILQSTHLKDSGLEDTNQSDFATSTPLSKRKTFSGSVSVNAFEKCTNYNPSELKKGNSEPDILSVSTINTSSESVEGSQTKAKGSKKRWNILKPPFRKGALDCLILWRGKKTNADKPK